MDYQKEIEIVEKINELTDELYYLEVDTKVEELADKIKDLLYEHVRKQDLNYQQNFIEKEAVII